MPLSSYNRIPSTPEDLDIFLKARSFENEHIEFKEAKQSFSKDELCNYCCALANEGGGLFILGVTNSRVVCGSQAFRNCDEIKKLLLDALKLRIDLQELDYHGKRVVIFYIPSRPFGAPLKANNVYWMRSGQSLVAMSEDMLQRIFNESGPDYSGQFCTNATMHDLDINAINYFQEKWTIKTGNQHYRSCSTNQLLEDAELVIDGKITYAALILLGTKKALGIHLPQSEIIFEYRSRKESIPYEERIEFREGFLLWADKILEIINKRNPVHQYRIGLLKHNITTFDPDIMREAILNALCHRDYRLGGSIFIKQYSHDMTVESPGGFPGGITIENILERQEPRNRRLAEALAKCGFIERSGQGVDLMYRRSLEQAKPLPSYVGTDTSRVLLTIDGTIRNIKFVEFIETIYNEFGETFSVQHLIVMNKIIMAQKISAKEREYTQQLIDKGIIERGTKQSVYILSQRFHEFTGKPATYTRQKKLAQAESLALLEAHIRRNQKAGSPFSDLRLVLPNYDEDTIRYYLQILKKDNKIQCIGGRRHGKWYPL